MKAHTTTLAGTAVLGALVVIFDYTLKFSGFKIVFPWLPFLKFDFTGIPIVLCFLLYGLTPGATTSAVAFFAILLRGGDVIGSSMKALAEFSTILGMTLSLKLTKKSTNFNRLISTVLGLTLRVTTMLITNLIVLPNFYGIPFNEALLLSPLIGVFNLIQGFISMFAGYLIYEAIAKRAPFLIPKSKIE